MTLQRDIDEILVRRFQAGDCSAFAPLTQKYRGRLLKVVMRIVHNQSDAEDVVQETLLRAYRALPTFRRESAFFTWIFRIGVNVAKKLRKAQMLRANVSIQLDQEMDGPPSYELISVDKRSPLSAIECKQALLALNAALDEMSPNMSMTLLLSGIDGMKYEEIAAFMCCPIGTVRSRISRARVLITNRIELGIGATKNKSLSATP